MDRDHLNIGWLFEDDSQRAPDTFGQGARAVGFIALALVAVALALAWFWPR